jgi:hypothetical protein
LRNARTGSTASSKGRVSSATCAAISRKRKAESLHALVARGSRSSHSWQMMVRRGPHLTREHASDLERATACAAGSLARRPAWLRASLSILASAEPHPERKSALNRAKVSTNGVVTSQTDRAEHRLFGGSSSRHSLRRASGGHRARKPHAKHRSWQRVSWQPWAINRNL